MLEGEALLEDIAYALIDTYKNAIANVYKPIQRQYRIGAHFSPKLDEVRIYFKGKYICNIASGGLTLEQAKALVLRMVVLE